MLYFEIPTHAYVDMEMEWKWKWNNSVIEQAGAEDRKLDEVALWVTDLPVLNPLFNRPCVAGAVLQTPPLLIKGNRAIADLRYWEEDRISPSTLIFAATVG